MTKQEIIGFAKKHKLNVDCVLSYVRFAVKRHGTTYQPVKLNIGRDAKSTYTPGGWVLNNSGRRVKSPSIDRVSADGTHYQNAELKITIPWLFAN